MSKKKTEGNEKRYTYPEILSTYFPNVEETEEDSNGEHILTSDNFFDILTKATKPHQDNSKKVKASA